jgi:transcription factor IIIB subunit 2
MFIEESTASMFEAFTKTVALIGNHVQSADPSVHLPALLTHLSTLIKPPPDFSYPITMNASLKKTLTRLAAHLQSIQQTAMLLCSLMARLSTLQHVPTPPTACAIVLLAIEGELQTSIPFSGELATVLGAHVGSAGSTVQARYKIIYDIVEDWVKDVPWLENYEIRRVVKVATGATRKVPKQGKRIVVAKGLKDTVAFQEEIWRKKVDAAQPPKLVLEEDDFEEDDVVPGMASDSSRITKERDVEHVAESIGAPQRLEVDKNAKMTRVCPKRKAVGTLETVEAEAKVRALYPWKKRKLKPQLVDHATAFLLSPLGTGVALPTMITSAAPALGSFAAAASHQQEALPLMAHLLSVDDSTLLLTTPPTRLQLLSVERGGGNEAMINDDELFESGELEDMMRSPQEIDLLRRTVTWDGDEDEEDEASATERGKGKVQQGMKRSGGCKKKKEKAPKGSQRVNMDALAWVLGAQQATPEEGLEKTAGDDPLRWADMVEMAKELGLDNGQDDDAGQKEDSPVLDYWDDKDGDKDEELDSPFDGKNSKDTLDNSGSPNIFRGADEEDVEEWRPLSPGGGNSGLDEGNWYEF